MRNVAGIDGYGYIVLKQIQMQKLIYALGFSIALALWPKPADSCSCVRVGVAEQVRGSACVFKGTVISRYPAQIQQFGMAMDGEAVRFRIERFYKGEMERRYLDVGVVYGGGACGYYFEQGKSYLVFAQKRLPAPILTTLFAYSHKTDLCSGNQLFSKQTESAILDATRPPFIW